MHGSLALQAAAVVVIHASLAAAERNCSSFAIGGIQLDFRSRPPHDTRGRPLQSCRAMSAYTCCSQRDDTAVVAAQRAFLLDGGAATPCARIASAVLCAACHGGMGTGALKGVDPAMCDSWYGVACGPSVENAAGDLASPLRVPTAPPARVLLTRRPAGPGRQVRCVSRPLVREPGGLPGPAALPAQRPRLRAPQRHCVRVRCLEGEGKGPLLAPGPVASALRLPGERNGPPSLPHLT